MKCDLYWPQEGTETYGTIQVTLVSEISFAYYVKRIFAIRCKANRKVGYDINPFTTLKESLRLEFSVCNQERVNHSSSKKQKSG